MVREPPPDWLIQCGSAMVITIKQDGACGRWCWHTTPKVGSAKFMQVATCLPSRTIRTFNASPLCTSTPSPSQHNLIVFKRRALGSISACCLALDQLISSSRLRALHVRYLFYYISQSLCYAKLDSVLQARSIHRLYINQRPVRSPVTEFLIA